MPSSLRQAGSANILNGMAGNLSLTPNFASFFQGPPLQGRACCDNQQELGRRIAPPPIVRIAKLLALPVFGDAQSEQTRIGDENVGRQRRIV